MKSPSATRTRAPSGRDAATSPAKYDTCAPQATRDGGSPMMRANASRERATDASGRAGVISPAARSRSAARTASWAARGGSP
ncbi:hypothetical protein GCM10010182_74000 [Actinomadura cremea]|nr:hypothetical protein GCM10010182_74000 [Actinomadura cremea]